MKPPLHAFARHLRREWRVLNLPAEKQTFIVAVSGGADSSALIAALNELKTAGKLDLDFVVVHFNHRLRAEESQADAHFVKNLAAQFGFQFFSGEWLGNEEKGNLEQAARRARYRFLTETAANCGAFGVLTGHTLNDQAETFLMRLLRGSGLDGLGAMKQISDLGFRISDSEEKSEISLVRPLLSWATREMTENYCRAREIDFRRDAMNEDESFLRVRVRRKLLPQLETYNPKIVDLLAQTSRLLGEETEELNLRAKEIFESVSVNSKLNAKVLKNYSAAMRRRVLRMWLEAARGSLKRIDAVHLRSVDRLLAEGAGNSFVELPGRGVVFKKNGLLIFETDKS